MRASLGCLLLMAAPLCSCGGKTLDCGQLPCPDELLIWGDLSYKGDEAVSLHVRFCRNEQCSEGTLQAPALGQAELALQGPLPALAQLASRGAKDTWQLSVRLNDGAGLDGDKISLRLTTVPGGTVIFDETASSVEYIGSRPNGPDCAPSCRSAIVTFN